MYYINLKFSHVILLFFLIFTSVFLPEADQSGSEDIDRDALCEELGISNEEDYSIAKGTPLLFRLIQKGSISYYY